MSDDVVESKRSVEPAKDLAARDLPIVSQTAMSNHKGGASHKGGAVDSWSPEYLRNELAGEVVVLTGGHSAEREISLQSGAAVLAAIKQLGLSVRSIDIAARDLPEQLLAKPAFAFIAVHGRGGEDGELQALLEAMQIPYSGSRVLGSALAMDKVKSKFVWSGAKVPTAPFRFLDIADSTAVDRAELADVVQQLGKRLFVKPAREGSSLGMSFAQSAAELEQAVLKAAEYDRSILVEQFIDGPEYTQPILDGVALPTIGIETDRAFYDYDAKYSDDATRFLLPSGLSAADERQVASIAERAFAVLGCSGWGRVDVMRDRSSGEFQVLEVNTVPGLTNHSLVPKSAAAAGVAFEELIGRIMLAALQAA